MKAFPTTQCTATADWIETTSKGGMDLRDYFAAKAMQAMIAQCSGDDFDDFVIAHSAYQMADFMLAKRDGKGFYDKE